MTRVVPSSLRSVASVAIALFALAGLAGLAPHLRGAAAPDPIVYTLRFPAPETHVAEIEAVIPTDARASIELMLPVWSPGFYGVGNYARNVQEFTARAWPGGAALLVDRPKDNHWRIQTQGAPTVVIAYRLLCQSTFVTGSWVGADFAVINGPSTFITLDEPPKQAKRPHEVHLVLPPAWKQSVTSLDAAPGRRPGEDAYIGPDYDVFIDSPIVAGTISLHEFDVAGTRLSLADFGDLGAWDGQQAADALKRIVEAHRRFLGELPFKTYVFLNAFRGGGGGLEHLNSSLLSSGRNPQSPTPTIRWLKYVSHEFFHAINVKRLRPIELGPFDYEKVPSTPSLWISEGLTTYYGDLAVVRSGVGTREDFLSGLAGPIRNVQTSPGRLVQTLEQSSLRVGTNSTSGVGGNRNTTISYYDKGTVVGLLLDARIRRMTNDSKSLDDGMRLAYERYSGERGFAPEQFQATISEVAGGDLKEFFRKTLASTEELEYTDMLDWFGLRFAQPGSPDPAKAWALEIRPDASDAQTRHLQRLVAPSADRVDIRVDTAVTKGRMSPIWAWFGHDEPNYTYSPDGQKLLSELAATAATVAVHMRTHNLLTTGDGTAALKWGSTNAYTEDANGQPHYDWTIVDRIIDTYLARKMKPLVEIGFMPQALSSHPEPYRHFWKPGDNLNEIYTGWSYPPRDYAKWRELVFQWVHHAVEKYGRREVESWWWEVWNEPDIGYWHGTPEDFLKLYDFAADGLKRALPTARIGGPEVTGPNGARTQQILRNFIEHCLRGTNYATGTIGSPLDLVTFHAKGSPQVRPEGYVRMSVRNQLSAIGNGLGIVASFPELKSTPVVIGESDPEGCAACPVRTNPSNAYRNGTMFSSYTAEQIARTYELADLSQVNLLGAVSWAFEFEGQPYFDGFRDLATNGIDKPVLNVFRMLGRMTGDRVSVTSTGGLSLEDVRDRSVRGAADISALAARDSRSVAVLVWNYHDDDVAAPATDVELQIAGLRGGRLTLTHYRVDTDHSNAYSVWQAMGQPQTPTRAERATLEQAGQLQMLSPPAPIDVKDGRVVVSFSLPRQGVSLVTLTW